MKRCIVMLLVLFALPAAALAQGLDNTLVIAANERIAGDVATVTRDIRVDGAVDGDVTSWSGAITVSGSVGGDVVSYGGTVTIAATAHVGGHVLASGGALHVADPAVVAGQAINSGGGGALASLLDLFAPTDGSGEDAIGRVLFGAGLGVLLLAFCLLALVFWPRRIASASATLRRMPARAFALGLLTTGILALALLPVAALLAASVIGLPLLLVLLALALMLYVFGLAVLVCRLASGLAGARGPVAQIDIRMIALAGGLVALIAITAMLAPLWGLMLFYLVASPGLGAMLVSRGGLFIPAYR